MEQTAEELKSDIQYGPAKSTLSDALSLSPTKAQAPTHKEVSAARYKLDYWLARIVQGICWPFFYVGYHACFSLTIKGKEKLKNVKGPVIFIANHISVYDSFIFDQFVPPFTAIPPFRFMGSKDFDIFYLKVLKYTGVIALIYLLFGVFKVTYGEGAEKALIPAYDIIKNGGTVAIFPEGRVWRYDKYGIGVGEKEPIGPFKWGAAILAKNTGAQVVPVSFKQHSRNMFRDYLDVNIGEPYVVDRNASPEVLTEEMRKKVVNLHLGESKAASYN